jgi:hypothetical protein
MGAQGRMKTNKKKPFLCANLKEKIFSNFLKNQWAIYMVMQLPNIILI